MLLSGKSVNAKEALSIGLINKMVSLGELIPSVEKLASTIIKNAPLSISATIKAVNAGIYELENPGLFKEQTEFSELFHTEDTQEGLSAFIEKRIPVYTGK